MAEDIDPILDEIRWLFDHEKMNPITKAIVAGLLKSIVRSLHLAMGDEVDGK